MTPVSTCPALLFLLLLLGPSPSSLQTYPNFQWKHMDYPKSEPDWDARRYCNVMMQRRELTSPVCKQLNSFIHEPPNVVNAICTTNGIPHPSGNLYDSIDEFSLTNYKLTGGRPPDSCDYRGKPEHSRIQVACNQGHPVHFQKRLSK